MTSTPLRLAALFSAGTLLAAGTTPFPLAASAETLTRAHGRCKLQSGDYVSFDGYCTVKQKRNGGITSFVVDLDNGSRYRFTGPNPGALHVETYQGIRNVSYDDRGDRGLFRWNEGGATNRLSVKLDSRHQPDVSHDDERPTSVGTALGALAGAVIGGLLTGATRSSGSSSDPMETAKEACLTAVARQTGNSRSSLSVIRAQSAESGIGVDVRVPAAQAPWFCLTDRSGKVEEVRYSGSEGAL